MTPGKHPAFGNIPYIARPHPEQLSHTGQILLLLWSQSNQFKYKINKNSLSAFRL